jgi:transcriptional regulator with XRE-family HTH domain
MRMGRPPKKSAAEIPQWAQRIKQARESASLSQGTLGEAVGVSQGTVSDWEQGKTEPNLTQYRAIASVTGADPIWLVFGADPSRSDSLSGIAAEANKQNRHFGWAFYEAARMFTEEGVNADFLYILTYVQKLLADANQGGDEASAKEALARKLEAERIELRRDLEEVRKKRL